MQQKDAANTTDIVQGADDETIVDALVTTTSSEVQHTTSVYCVASSLTASSSRRSIALLEEVRHRHPRSGCAQAGRFQSQRISDGAQDVGSVVGGVEVGGVASR